MQSRSRFGALKRDVQVRTVQDPDTFRDLLYAVVTGQRNHEDSRRKGLAVAAGRRRAVERGDYTGAISDGYRRVVEVDDTGAISKRLEIDPERRALIEMIFAMALHGKRTGAIARTVNEAGWRTKPLIKTQQPKAWDIQRILDVLQNPRYAGLAATKGEIVGHGHWPTYLTEREHYRLRARLAQPRPTTTPRPLEPYLLARLGSCGYCGSALHCSTGQEREDGTFARRYICASHNRERYGTERCPAPRIDADVVEAMFVSTIRSLLLEDTTDELESRRQPASLDGRWSDSPERQRVLAAVLTGDDREIDAALGGLLARVAPEAAMLQRVAISSRHARQLEVAQKLEGWANDDRAGQTEASRIQTRELNGVLLTWFSTVTLAIDGHSVVIAATIEKPQA